jgi:hypothetical protein
MAVSPKHANFINKSKQISEIFEKMKGFIRKFKDLTSDFSDSDHKRIMENIKDIKDIFNPNSTYFKEMFPSSKISEYDVSLFRLTWFRALESKLLSIKYKLEQINAYKDNLKKLVEDTMNTIRNEASTITSDSYPEEYSSEGQSNISQKCLTCDEKANFIEHSPNQYKFCSQKCQSKFHNVQ